MSLRLLQTEYVKTAANNNFGSGAAALTAGWWVKTSSTFTGDDLSNHNEGRRLRGATGNVPQMRWWAETSGVQNQNSDTAWTGGWDLVVWTHEYDDTDPENPTGVQKLYHNGVLKSTLTIAEPLLSFSSVTERLGDAIPNWDSGDQALFGGDFIIAGQALTEAEVAELYANRTGGDGTLQPQSFVAEGVVVRCHPLNQTSGTVTNGDAGLADLGDNGNALVLGSGTPSWVDDDPGHNWSEEISEWEYTPIAPAYRIPALIAKLLHGGDCRVLQLADSFGGWVLTGRLLPYGWLLADPSVNLTAFCSGDPLTAANGIMRAFNACTGTTFDVQSSDYEIENGSGNYFALPVHDIRGIYCDSGLTLNGGTRFVQYRWRNAELATSGRRSWLATTGNAKARLLFLAAAAGADQLPDIQLKDVQGGGTVDCDFTDGGCRSDDTSDPTGEAVSDGEINATYPDILLTNTGSAELHLDVLKGATNPVGDDTFLQLAGALLYKVDGDGNRIPGLYFQTLDGNSWSYAGFYNDTASTANAKSFSIAQARPWLARTTLDPGQRMVIVQNLADEKNTQAQHKTKMEALITTWDAICDGITTLPPLYLFIVQFAHEITGDPDEERQNQLDKAAAAYQVAQTNSRVGYISLYQMMDGVYATTDAASGITGGLAEFAAWATARGWDAWTNGGEFSAADLTDGMLDPQLHLNGMAEASAMGSLMTEALDRSEQRRSRGGATTKLALGVL